MNLEDFEIERWEGMDDTQRLRTANQLSWHLPDWFILDRIEEHSLGGQRHPVAFFDWLPSRTFRMSWCKGNFALIPGGAVTLGYDREHPWEPTLAQQESWRFTQEEYGVPNLPKHLDAHMTPLRRVQLKPFLIEVAQTETMIVRDNREFGFRSPLSDEWEWACAAGSRTLWRWGNDCPTDGYPTQYSHYEPDLYWHNHLNAFGLTIAHNDYCPDYCEDGIRRGGDGGSTTCGGAGFLDAWLLLSSSYFQKDHRGPNTTEGRGSRRVFPLEMVLS